MCNKKDDDDDDDDDKAKGNIAKLKSVLRL